MNVNDGFDRQLREWFAAEGSRAAPARLAASVTAITAARRPRAAWLVALRGQGYASGPAERSNLAGRPVLILALIAILVAVLLAGLAAVGSTPRPLLLTPTAPPSALVTAPASLPVVIANPSALPTEAPALVAPSPSACLASWSSTATTSDVTANGPRMIMWSFGGWPAGDGPLPRPPSWRGLFLSLLEPVSSLPGLTVVPATPPFRTPSGTTVKMAGTVFLKIVLDGVTGHEGIVDNDVVSASDRPRQQFVNPPVLELRRLARVGSKETWIVGLDGPVCLRPLLLHDFITQEQVPGDNVLFLELDPVGG